MIRLVGLGPSASVLNTGLVDASAADIRSSGGYIDITGANIRQAGYVKADAFAGNAGTIRLESSNTTLVTENGTVSAKSTGGGIGGHVALLGERVGLFDQSMVDVSGTAGGGEALIGGDYKGENPNIRNAQATVIDTDTTVLANATGTGDGGKVVVWADDYTNFAGTIEAKGGVTGGDGGFVETSAKDILVARGSVDASAVNGIAGEWLLDPSNVSLEQLNGRGDQSTGGSFDLVPPPPEATFTPTSNAVADIDQIVTSLEGGTNVTINTGTGAQDGDITVTDSISVTLTSAVTFALDAANHIFVNNTITASGDALTLILDADSDASGAGNVTVSFEITTNGGDVHLLGQDMFITAAINAGGGTISFTKATAGAFELGNAAGTSGTLNSTKIGFLTAGTLTIGQATKADGATVVSTTVVNLVDDVDFTGGTISNVALVASADMDFGTSALDATGFSLKIDGIASDISLGATVAAFQITNAELANITAGALTVQTTRAITVDALTAAATATVSSVTLVAGTDITFAAGAAADIDFTNALTGAG